MRKNRNEIQIILEFLKCVSDGNEQVSTILSRVNITYQKFKEIVEYLSSRQMIEVIEGGNEKQVIRITQKGVNFIRDYERFRKLVEDNYGFKL